MSQEYPHLTLVPTKKLRLFVLTFVLLAFVPLFHLDLSSCHSYSPNQLLVWLNLSFTLITLGALLIDWFVFDPFIQYVTLLYGTFIGWYGIMDIWDDTISRTVEGSDAHACFQMWKCCLPRCVGVQFAILAIICQALGLYFALVSLVGERFNSS